MKIMKRKDILYLTEKEQNILREASKILDKIAEGMGRELYPSCCNFDDDEVWGACEIIDDIVEHAKTEKE